MLGRAHPHGDAEALDHFARGLAQNMHAEHFIGVAIHHQFHQGAVGAARQSIFHRPEAGFVNHDIGMAFTRLFLAHADGAEFGGREHGCRDHRMRGHHGAAAEHRIGKGVALADRHRRQRGAVGDIADRIDRRHHGLGVLVDRNGPLLAQLNSRRFQPEASGVGIAAGGIDHPLAGKTVAAVQMHSQTPALPLDAVD